MNAARGAGRMRSRCLGSFITSQRAASLYVHPRRPSTRMGGRPFTKRRTRAQVSPYGCLGLSYGHATRDIACKAGRQRPPAHHSGT